MVVSLLFDPSSSVGVGGSPHITLAEQSYMVSITYLRRFFSLSFHDEQSNDNQKHTNLCLILFQASNNTDVTQVYR